MWWTFGVSVGADAHRQCLKSVSMTPSACAFPGSGFSSTRRLRDQPASFHSIAGPMISKQVLKRLILASLLLSLWLIPQVVRGDGGPNLYWDIPTTGPSGAWDTASASWSADPAGGGQIAWQNGSNAVFSATGLEATGDFVVSLAANVTVGDLAYTGGNLGSALQIAAGVGNTITMANAQMNVTIDMFTTLTVAPAITGVGSHLVLQNGTLVLTGANTYSGGTTISTGTLQMGNGNITGSIVGAVVNDDTFNIVNANTSGITTITNNSLGTTNFMNATTAGTIAITNAGGTTNFMDVSTAGNAAITNNGGFTQFFDTSTAGNATITNNSGFTEFFDTSTAGFATITNNDGGETVFNNASTAGNSTVTTNSGGLTLFFDTSTGENARFITNAGGVFDISSLTSAGMTAGSIEGGGTYFLGSKALTVGLNNLSTVVSGIIVDGGINGGIGGSLIKVGTGTLTLTGASTYTGVTAVSAGTLEVDGALGNTAVTVQSGATLAGQGTIEGSVTI
jgi:autotransporter-associated beta strand protein